MKYSQHEEETEPKLLENLEALCHSRTPLAVDPGAFLSDEDDSWMHLTSNARIDLEVECWGRRLA